MSTEVATVNYNIEADGSKIQAALMEVSKDFDDLGNSASKAAGAGARAMDDVAAAADGAATSSQGAGSAAVGMASDEEGLKSALAALKAELEATKAQLEAVAAGHNKAASAATTQASSTSSATSASKGFKDSINSLSEPIDVVWFAIGKVNRVLALLALALEYGKVAGKAFGIEMHDAGDAAEEAARKMDAAWRVIEYEERKKQKQSQDSTKSSFSEADRGMGSARSAEDVTAARGNLNDELLRLQRERDEAVAKSRESELAALRAKAQSDAAIEQGKDASGYKAEMTSQISRAEFYDKIAEEIAARIEAAIAKLNTMQPAAGLPATRAQADADTSRQQGFERYDPQDFLRGKSGSGAVPDAGGVKTWDASSGDSIIREYQEKAAEEQKRKAAEEREAAERLGNAMDESSQAHLDTINRLILIQGRTFNVAAEIANKIGDLAAKVAWLEARMPS